MHLEKVPSCTSDAKYTMPCTMQRHKSDKRLYRTMSTCNARMCYVMPVTRDFKSTMSATRAAPYSISDKRLYHAKAVTWKCTLPYQQLQHIPYTTPFQGVHRRSSPLRTCGRTVDDKRPFSGPASDYEPW